MSIKRVVWHKVAAGYGGTTVVENIDFAVAAGERVGILGRNGAGKTTTLSAAMGFAQLRSGTISFDGEPANRLSTSRRSRMGLAHVPQTRDIFKSLTVEENLLAGLQGGAKARLDRAYDIFPRLAERRRNTGAALSGGEQQMLSIARALMAEPSIILMDEPLEGLAPVIAQEVMATIRRLAAEEGLGVVLVEQHVRAVMAFCDRILVLERGSPVFWGPTAELGASVLDRAIGLAAH
jgi:branched-chain amino acid transport system ATP-binding protein